MDRNPNRSWEFHPSVPSISSGIFIMGQEKGQSWYSALIDILVSAFPAPLGDFPGNSSIWRSTVTAPGYVLPSAFVSVDHIILGAMVGDQTQKVIGGGFTLL